MSNEPVQARAGANFPGIFEGVAFQVSGSLKKVTQKVGLLLENDKDDLRLIVTSFSPGVTVYNRTTDPVDIELLLEDAEGNRVILDSATVAINGSDVLSPLAPGYLAKGEKLYYRVTSAPSITTGSGLVLHPLLAQSGGLYGRDRYIQRITAQNPTVELQAPPGLSSFGVVSGAGGVIVTALNFGTSAITLDTVTLVGDDGVTEVALTPATAVPAGEAKILSATVLTPPSKTRLAFSGLPAGPGPLVIGVDTVFPFNQGPLDLIPGV
jgi:hypothetical protein